MALAKAGKIFNVPVIYTSVETKSFSGYIWPELLAVHPDVKPIERTSMNSQEDAAFVKAVEATGRKKLIISALWTEVCLTFPALMALEAGYEVYVVTDTSGGTSVDAHERSIDRMVQAGAVPVTGNRFFLSTSATGPAKKPTTPSWIWYASTAAPTVWAWIMPIPWCMARQNVKPKYTSSFMLHLCWLRLRTPVTYL